MDKFKLKKILLVTSLLSSSLLSLGLISYQSKNQKDIDKSNSDINNELLEQNGRNGSNIYKNIIKKINNDLGIDFDKKIFDTDAPDYELYVKKYTKWVERNFEYLTKITNYNGFDSKENNNLFFAYNGGFQLRSNFWNYYWYIPSWNRLDLWKKSTGDQEIWNDIQSLAVYGAIKTVPKLLPLFLKKILPKVAVKLGGLFARLSIPGAGIACLTQCILMWISHSSIGNSGVVCRIFSPLISPPVFTGAWSFEEDDYN